MDDANEGPARRPATNRSAPPLRNRPPAEPVRHADQYRPGRNDICWCGSGKKYKKCHMPHDEA